MIDHLDGNPFNNKVENLSLKTLGGNQKNRFQQLNNTTGSTGVSRVNNGGDCWYYVAYWYESNGLRKSKYFSISKLGEETAKMIAIDYRKEQIDRLILEGMDYTARHGK